MAKQQIGETVTIKLDKPVFQKLEALAKAKGYKDPSACLIEIILDNTKEQDAEESNTFSVPRYLVKAFKKAAKERGQQLKKYVDDLGAALLLGDLSPFENC